MRSGLLSLLRKLERRSPDQYRRDLWIIVVAGVLFKLAILWLEVGQTRTYDQHSSFGTYVPDSLGYYGPAVTLARSFAYHSLNRTPGYPAFLALIYFLTRDPNPLSNLNLATIYVAQSALITLGCLPLAGAVRRLTGFRSFALVAAAVWAFHNSARFYAHWVLAEALTATLMCCLAYAMVRALEDAEPKAQVELAAGSVEAGTKGDGWKAKKVSPFWFGMTGLAMFALTLVRPSCSLLALPVGSGMLFAYFRLYGRRRQGLALALLVLALPLSSQELWALRNYEVEGQWYYCALSTFGVYAYGVEVPVEMATGKSWGEAFTSIWTELWDLQSRMEPHAVDRVCRHRMWSKFKERPAAVVTHYLGSIPCLFVPALPLPPIGITPPPNEWSHLAWDCRGLDGFLLLNSIVEFGTTCGLLAMLIVGIVSRYRWSSPAQSAVFLTTDLAFFYWISIHAVSARYTGFLGASRFFFPIVPLLIVTAAAVAARMPWAVALSPAAKTTGSVEPGDAELYLN